MAKEYKAGLYLRLSREDEQKNNESNSITNQRMITTEFAEQWEIPVVKEYVDDGESGANFDRPGFKEMIADIKAGVINCVIVKDLSRFGRSLSEGGKYIQEFSRSGASGFAPLSTAWIPARGPMLLRTRPLH